MGVANHNSIAWAIARQLAAQGAELAFTYIEAMEKRVRPLGEPDDLVPACSGERYCPHAVHLPIGVSGSRRSPAPGRD